MLTKLSIQAATCAGLLIAAGIVQAQEFPSKSIKIVTGAAGSATDVALRVMRPGVMRVLGQPLVIDPRGSTLAASEVARAAPDGYTILYYGGTLWLEPLMRSSSPYDTLRDLAPISWTISTPNVLVVPPSLPVKSVQELIALAKAKPGELNFGTSSPGSMLNLAAQLFKTMTGTDMVRVPYKGAPAAVTGLIANEVQIVFSTTASAMPFVKSGKLKVLGITTPQRSPNFPDLPTISASGVPGYETDTAYALFAPARTPPPIVTRLNRAFVASLTSPEVKELLAKSGFDVVASTPEELTKKVQRDIAVFGKVIKDADIREE